MKLRSLLLSFVVVSSAASIAFGQKCGYDPHGATEVNFVWMTNELDAGTMSGLKGKVTDRTGEGIPGARLVLFKVSKGRGSFIGSVEADYKGRYCFGKLSAGSYRLEVGQTNFQRYVYTVKISPNGRKGRLNMELGIGY